MGGPMAANLAAGGFAVQSYDPNGRGNRRSVREAAQGAGFLVTMLPDGDVVRDVVIEALPSLRPDALVVDMSSSDPFGTQALGTALAAKRVRLVDAPVSGARPKAKDGTLTFMVGGERRDYARALPLLRAMGRQVFHVGPLGAGHAVKALNNYLGAAGTIAGFEALLVAQAFGVEPRAMLAAINASTGRNSTTENKIAQQVLSGAFASGFKLGLMAKDVGIAADLARGVGVKTPYLKETLRTWRAAQRALPAGADHTELFKYLARATPALRPARGKRVLRARG